MGYEVILDQTAFYPEGGGQPSDIGTLGESVVKEVHEKNGELLHYTDRALEPGTEVQGKINWDRRFDLMQQHSGEHIVSGLIHEAFGYDNVGFHMGSDVITIDFDGMLDETQMAVIEAKANPWILFDGSIYDILLPVNEVHILIIALVILFLVDLIRYKKNLTLAGFLNNQNLWFRYAVIFALLFFILIYGQYGPGFSAKQFIYFQF